MNTTYKTLILVAILVFGFSNTTEASVAYSQEINLAPGWNIVSTPRVLDSHSFSALEDSTNFDIYVLDASKTSGWSTLADLNQITFTPLFGYFINNKTGTTTTLTFNYKANVSPNERLFERTFSTAGWYSLGIANSTYAKNTNSSNADTDNPGHILNSLRPAGNESTSGGYYNSVIDLAYVQGDVSSVAVSDTWEEAVHYEVNTLEDFRETKAYAVYINNNLAQYTGFQDNTVPVCSDGVDNDGDGLIDMDDSGCTNPLDEDETDIPPPEPATIVIAVNANSPKVSEIIASEGTGNDSKDDVELLRFDVQAEGDAVTITNLAININQSGSTATTSTFYIFEGGTLIASQSGNVGNGGKVIFSDMDYVVSKDTTNVLTIKADIEDATSDATVFSVSMNSSDVISKNSLNEILENEFKSGSVTGANISVRNIGPELTLVSKSIAKNSAGFAGATSTAQATFSINIKAVGGDIYFGPQASSTFGFKIYKDGIVANLESVASSTSWSIPSGVVTSGSSVTAGGFMLPEGNTVTVPVDFLFEGRDSTGVLIDTDSYAIGLEYVKWNLGAVDSINSDFMSGLATWKTSSIVMP